jgi:circadian clock protein KaiB
MNASQEGILLLLFVAGDAPRTRVAVENLGLALTEFRDRNFRLEIVDVFDDAGRAIADRVLVTPTLLAPGSSRRLVGDLSEKGQLRYFLSALDGGK